jgi:biopolymer transport protein ExbD
MVDLGFLLIAFFIMTTELTRPVVMPIHVPRQGPDTPVPRTGALTILLTGDHQLWYYEGNWEDAISGNAVLRSDFSPRGLRRVISDRKRLINGSGDPAKADRFMIIVKADEQANYRNIVDMLDEVLINDVKRYALVSITAEEKRWLKDRP